MIYTKSRIHTPEQLDNLSLSGAVLHDTLRSLQKINALFGTHAQLRKAVLLYAMEHPQQAPFRIVDLGCGSGDCLTACLEVLHAHGIHANGLGIDGNPETVAYAKRHKRMSRSLTFRTANILHPSFSIPDCDIMISSHFIYHFDEIAFQLFLQRIQNSTLQCVIFSELYRNRFAYFLFWCFGRIAPISKMAQQDGLVAIQRAFSINELKNSIHHSGIQNYTVQKKPWFRMLATINLHL